MAAVLTVFDGHNDTLTRDDADDFATGREGGHVDLPRARAGGLGGGIFAAFTDTPGDRWIEGEPAAPIGQDRAAGVVMRTLGRLLELEREGHVAARPRARRPRRGARGGHARRGRPHRGRRGRRPRPAGARRAPRRRPALARPGLEPPERVRPRRAVRLPQLAGHRPGPHRRRASGSCAAAPSSASPSTSATSTSGLLGRRRARPRAADRLALGRARAVPRQPQPHGRPARRDRRVRRAGRHRLRGPLRPPRRRRGRRHPAGDDRRPRPPRRRPDRRRPRRARLGLRRRDDPATRSATSRACRGCSTRSAPPASARTRSSGSPGATGGACSRPPGRRGLEAGVAAVRRRGSLAESGLSRT